MKVVVIGGTGRIGKKLVRRLRQLAVETVAASPSLGVDAVTGVGLAQALMNSPSRMVCTPRRSVASTFAPGAGMSRRGAGGV